MPGPWKPQLSPVDLRTFPLSPEEAFVASRLDGQTSVEQLAQVTGLGGARVAQALDRLSSLGALVPPEPPGPSERANESGSAARPLPVSASAASPLPAAAPESEEEPDASPEAVADRGATHLALYRDAFHALPSDERAQLASVERGARLSALCFDPLPAVIRAVLQNPNAGPEQARLIAAHHQNTAGLEWLLQRSELVRDAQVQRLLWRNPQLNEGQLRRLTQTKRLLELWKLTVSREATSQTRAGTAKVLRARFTSGASEEKVELIITTDGRALAGLAGLPIDGKTAALLSSRPYNSPMLVQNLAAWAAAPPSLIAHLLKQPIVQRQPQLRAALARHPNAPVALKRG